MIVRTPSDKMSPQRHPLHSAPSLAASLDDFRAENSSTHLRQSPTFEMPSQHSGFRSSSVAEDLHSDAESSVDTSASPWSPPAWRKRDSDWFTEDGRLAPSAVINRGLGSSPGSQASRETSPLEARPSARGSLEPEGILRQAAGVPLPASPEKAGTMSPTPEPIAQEEEPDMSTPVANNYIRFSVRADVQHRTDPLEAIILYWRRVTKTWSSTLMFFTSILVAMMSFNYLTRSPDNTPGPDLVKVAGIARSFEPIMSYSEVGQRQISQLQDTSVAVWDLGESVRLSNMTSAPIITTNLDELSVSMKTLADDLTKFFARINGDVDSVLNVMEWAHRELSHVTASQPSQISNVVDNLSSLTVSTSRGKIPHFSPQVHRLLGLQNSHYTQRVTLSRTFEEFLGVIDDSIVVELKLATKLQGMFEAIDHKFGGLQRTIARESVTQEALTDAELATLWVRVFGRSASTDRRVRRYEKNRQLLQSLRERTAFNKRTLDEHKSRLLGLQTNIEQLKKRVSSPLLRAENTSMSGIQEQISGLEGTWKFLMTVRSAQKGRIAQAWYGIDGETSQGWPTIGEETQ